MLSFGVLFCSLVEIMVPREPQAWLEETKPRRRQGGAG